MNNDSFNKFDDLNKIRKTLGKLWWDDYSGKILKSSNKSYIDPGYGYILVRLLDDSASHRFKYFSDIDNNTMKSALLGLKKLHLLRVTNQISSQTVDHEIICDTELTPLGQIYARYLYPHNNIILLIQNLITLFFIIIPTILLSVFLVAIYFYLFIYLTGTLSTMLIMLTSPIVLPFFLTIAIVLFLYCRWYPHSLYHNRRATKRQFIQFYANHRDQFNFQQYFFVNQHYTDIRALIDHSMFD